MTGFIIVHDESWRKRPTSICINSICHFADNFIKLKDGNIVLCSEYHGEINDLIEKSRKQENVV